MKEIILERAGESQKRTLTEQNKKNDGISYLKKISGIEEEFLGEKKIYINKPKDIEKFYYSLVKAFEGNAESLAIVKDIFRKVVY